MAKQGLGISVLEAARSRISRVFDEFPRIYISFSGGKDSCVMLHLVMDEAIKRQRRVGVLFIDLEAQYAMTIEHVEQMFDRYVDHIDPYWISLPINLRNAVSQFEPQWLCWDKSKQPIWVRGPSRYSIVTAERFPFFREGMEFEEFTPSFGEWYAGSSLTACFVGIRADESLNRWRSIASKSKSKFAGLAWTTWVGGPLYNAYPIYDWATEDVWTYLGRNRLPYNRVYDRMHQAGLTIHQARICQPYGDDQRKGLWLFHVLEPETWGRVVARVNGANQGALYAKESGNILGRMKVDKPSHLTWRQFSELLLDTMPANTAENFRNKIAVFLRWYQDRGYPNGIPDEGSATDRATPSWTRICKSLLRNDYWCKGLSFSQHKTEAFSRYQKLMKRRRREWNII